MPDDKLTTPEPLRGSQAIAQNKQVTLTSLRARVAAKQLAIQQTDPSTMPNRMGLLLDISGSMSGQPLARLQEAISAFIDNCNPKDCALSLYSFPEERLGRVKMTADYSLLTAAVYSFQASGGTPMSSAMQDIWSAEPVTRCVLVSDGEPDSTQAAYDMANMFRESKIPIDCIHIGHSSSGEDVLIKIAELTGGKFIKFTDVNQLVGGLKYLTPGYYGMLTGGAISASEIGAREIK